MSDLIKLNKELAQLRVDASFLKLVLKIARRAKLAVDCVEYDNIYDARMAVLDVKGMIEEWEKQCSPCAGR